MEKGREEMKNRWRRCFTLGLTVLCLSSIDRSFLLSSNPAILPFNERSRPGIDPGEGGVRENFDHFTINVTLTLSDILQENCKRKPFYRRTVKENPSTGEL